MYVFVIPALAWFANVGVARRFCLVAYVACWFCNLTKGIFCLPRPPASLHVRGKHEGVAQQYGFPSGHSGINSALAWHLASETVAAGLLSPGIVWVVAMAHTLHVCFSRLYLGVHSLADILGGLLFGVVTIALFETIGWTVDLASVESATAQLLTAIVSILALCCYQDKRDTNTAFTEPLSFGGIHLGACLGSGIFAGLAPKTAIAAPPSARFGSGIFAGLAPKVAIAVPPSALAVALQYVIGLVALGIVRSACSALVKMLFKPLPAGRAASVGAVVRKYVCGAIAGIWVFAVHPAVILAYLGF